MAALSHVQVDAREPKRIVDALVARGASCLSLPVGDYVIHTDDNKVIVMERKDWSDAKASIKDGRWADQKQRMIAAAEGHDSVIPVLLIQGCDALRSEWDRYETGSTVTDKAVRHAILNSMVHDGFHVVLCGTEDDTLDSILFLAKTSSQKNASRRHGTLGRTPKQTWGQDIFKNQLTVIIGVSDAVARLVVAEYPKPAALCRAISEGAPSDVVQRIASLVKPGGRTVGKAVASRIVDAFS